MGKQGGLVVGRNILVIGSPGSGKSTLARRLGARFGLRAIHMDQIYWMPGWRLREAGARAEMVRDAMVEDGWVFDGNNFATLPLRAAKADTVIWLDLPRWLCLLRVLRRIAAGYGRVRPDMADGCPERFDREFLLWVWAFPRHSRPGLKRFFVRTPLAKHRLTSARAVAAFLADVQQAGL